MSKPTVRQPTKGARHVVGSSGAEADGGEGGEEQEGAEAGVPLPSEGDVEGGEPEAPEMPELLTPTREELEKAFPNPPKAPYPTLPDPRGFTAEQLAAGGSLPVSYGGQVRALHAASPFSFLAYFRRCFAFANTVKSFIGRNAELRVACVPWPGGGKVLVSCELAFGKGRCCS